MLILRSSLAILLLCCCGGSWGKPSFSYPATMFIGRSPSNPSNSKIVFNYEGVTPQRVISGCQGVRGENGEVKTEFYIIDATGKKQFVRPGEAIQINFPDEVKRQSSSSGKDSSNVNYNEMCFPKQCGVNTCGYVVGPSESEAEKTNSVSDVDAVSAVASYGPAVSTPVQPIALINNNNLEPMTDRVGSKQGIVVATVTATVPAPPCPLLTTPAPTLPPCPISTPAPAPVVICPPTTPPPCPTPAPVVIVPPPCPTPAPTLPPCPVSTPAPAPVVVCPPATPPPCPTPAPVVVVPPPCPTPAPTLPPCPIVTSPPPTAPPCPVAADPPSAVLVPVASTEILPPVSSPILPPVSCPPPPPPPCAIVPPPPPPCAIVPAGKSDVDSDLSLPFAPAALSRHSNNAGVSQRQDASYYASIPGAIRGHAGVIYYPSCQRDAFQQVAILPYCPSSLFKQGRSLKDLVESGLQGIKGDKKEKVVKTAPSSEKENNN